MKRIRVALVTNALGPPTRGNGTTVARWSGRLPDVGVDLSIVAPGEPLPATPVDLVHGYHAIHGGRDARTLAEAHGLPLVVSFGGTDAYALAGDGPRHEEIRDVLATATLVTGPFACFGTTLEAQVGGPPPAYAIVPRGVVVPDTPPPEIDAERLRVVLPAGLRVVKDPLLGIRLADALRTRGLPIELELLGPSLDPGFARTVEAEVDARPHVTLGERPRDEMPGVYRTHDVVWNTSLHEGGSNALLEGLAYGCAAYARDVEGNRPLLGGNGAPGTLFDPEAPGFIDRAEQFHRRVLTESPEIRAARVMRTRRYLQAKHDPTDEARALRLAYERALS